MHSTMEVIVVLVFGGVGAAGRYLMEFRLKTIKGWSAMRTVTVINALGTFVLALLSGILLGMTEQAFPHMSLRPTVSWILLGEFDWVTIAGAAVTALCGGFTTFSTAMVEAVKEPKGLRSSTFTLGFMLITSMIAFLATIVVVTSVTSAVATF